MYMQMQQQRQLMDAIQLPRAELMKFDGNPLEYWTLFRLFENNVERVTADSNARLIRIMQYCTGKALKVIKCCSVMDPHQGFIMARRILRERFGNNYAISEAWINTVSSRQPIKSNDRAALQNFADDL